MDIETYIQQRQNRLQLSLKKHIQPSSFLPKKLFQAMHYMLFGGGKYIRPLLVYAAGESVGASLSHLDAPAMAIECIHNYSLIHDDLPCMDNDDFRRGKPTCHKVFGEATAVLAGDALLSLAFSLLGRQESNASSSHLLKMFEILSQAIGPFGMVGGQALEGEITHPTLEQLDTIQRLKTGALLQVSLCIGALANPILDPLDYQRFEKCGLLLGKAFQLQDDLMDLNKDESTDPASNSHATKNLASYLGVTSALKTIDALYFEALESIAALDNCALPLRKMIEKIHQRTS